MIFSWFLYSGSLFYSEEEFRVIILIKVRWTGVEDRFESEKFVS